MLVKLFKSKWFWITVAVALVIAIFLDLILAAFLIKNLAAAPWNPYLLYLITGVILVRAIAAKKSILESKQLMKLGNILFIIALVWTFNEHGISRMFQVLFAIYFITKILRWIMPKKKTGILFEEKSFP